MTVQEPQQQWPRIRARINYLEREVLTWGDALTNNTTPSMADVDRARMALDLAQTELAELREIIAYWERAHQNGKIPLRLQAGLIAVAAYMAIMLLVVLYLLALARGG